MSAKKRFLAFDIGASNGRAIVGEWDGKRLGCEDIYHFPNEPVQVHGSIYWDALRLFGDIKKGLAECAGRYGSEVDGIGIDTWGVDFSLLDTDGRLLGNPHHYRDKRAKGMPEAIRLKVDAYEVFSATGVQIERVGTLAQLYSMVCGKSPQLAAADRLLMMPSLFAYFLTGNKLDEHSGISNTALISFENDAPVTQVFEKLGIPQRILPKAVKPGTILGPLSPSVTEETGMGAIPVIAPATHDTASAVISVPADPSTDWAFLSCGTWSILGIETDRPLTSREAFEAGVTSAATADGKYMPRLNITGLWILQELRRIWNKQGAGLDWETMVGMAESAPPFAAFIDADSPELVNPPDMPRAISDHLRKSGQSVPDDKGTMIRIVIECLALKYRDKLTKMEQLSGKRKQLLHVLGGGVRNALLCQFTANAVGVPVIAGPVEATAMGNLLVQMVGARVFDSVAQGRQALRDSCEVREYAPTDTTLWDEAYSRYLKALGRE